MDKEYSPVRRGDSWVGPTAVTLATGCSMERAQEECGERGDQNSIYTWDKDPESRTRVKPALLSSSTHTACKTSLTRSASLSEKELKEARTRSHIIAAQLTVPSSGSSRGVRLFNRRRQRVDAFTLVSSGTGRGGGRGESWNAPELPAGSTLPQDEEQLSDGRPGNTNPKRGGPQDSGTFVRQDMEEAGHVEDSVRERHFLPVREKDVEPSEEHGEVAQGDTPTGEERGEPNGAWQCSSEPQKAIHNGCHSTSSKQPGIINRTARPFLSPSTVGSAESGSPAPAGPPISSTPHLPAHQDPPPRSQPSIRPPFPLSSRPVFSPPPPAPSYPMPPLPSTLSPPPPLPSHSPLRSAMSPPPGHTYYAPPTAPRPVFIPQLLSERRSTTPIRTGLLEEGRARRGNRKSMFTFQEKPKLSPNPELLSLVQGADEMRRVRSQPESQQEEELLALGAEASNFLAKDEGGVEEALVPEWASTLKSRTRSRAEHAPEHAPEQALSAASGRGAELFAQRQTRMARYVHEKAPGPRSPSPTQSLPPSWAYPSNMPGRVKAIVSSSNISAQISKTLQTQQATNKRIVPAKAVVPEPAPALDPDSPAVENGCSKVELELSRHQPYQLNSSLFILNPIKDPLSTLPRAAPPSRPVVGGLSYSRQTSLPSSPVPTQQMYRSAHCFSPPTMPVGMASDSVASAGPAMATERVASPRSAAQTPKPTFSAKKAGITPQVLDKSPAVTPPSSSSAPAPWSPSLSCCSSRGERPPCAPWSPSTQRRSLVTSPPPQNIQKPVTSSPTPRCFQSSLPFQPTTPASPPWERTCQSSVTFQETKANHRLLAKNIINAAKRKNSPSPGALSSHSLPISPMSSSALPFEAKHAHPGQTHSPVVQPPRFTSPPGTPTGVVRSPLRLYNTRSLTDSDASLESEDSELLSPSLRSFNTCPRAWTRSLRVRRGGRVSEDL